MLPLMTRLVAAFLLVLLPAAAMPNLATSTAAEWQAPRISPGAAKLLVERGAILIDVREPNELAAQGWLAGAINLPMSRLKSLAAAGNTIRVPRGRPIVLYCGSGARAGRAALLLGSKGYNPIYNLGGFKTASAVLAVADRRRN